MNTAFVSLKTILVVACFVMAFIFLILPLPANNCLRKYRISLRFLAGAYFIMGTIKCLLIIFNVSEVNLISIVELVIDSVQAPLFTFALITLFNPKLISKSFLIKVFIPFFFLVFFYLVFMCFWGDPPILNLEELRRLAFHPTVIVRELFVIYYMYLLVYLTRLFCKQIHLYEIEIDNFFADNQSLHVSWIRYSFYVCLFVGICAFLSLFFYSSLLVFIFNIISTLFFISFALFYIQYPGMFIYINQTIFRSDDNPREFPKNQKRLVWTELRDQIITNKYYLSPGLTIEDMAHYLKIGRTTLSTFINNEEGMNFNIWVNHLRIEEAKTLLMISPSYNITQIAEMIGYSEPSNFSRQFKLITNESPSVWRQNRQS